MNINIRGVTQMKTENDRAEWIAKRDKLRARLEKIKTDFSTRLDTDSTERAVELENVEVLNEIQRVTEEELAKVEYLLSES